MSIKLQYDAETEVPEQFKDLYKNVDGKFVADIEGVKPFEEYKKVYQEANEVREKYKALETKVAAYGEITPEQLAEYQEKIKELEIKASQTKDPTEVNKLANELASRDKKVFEREKAALEAEKAMLIKNIENLNQEKLQRKLEDRLRKASSNKINPDVFDDIVLNAQRDGLSYEELENDFFHKETGRNVERWLNDKLEEKKYWLPYSESGGASGGNGGLGSKKKWDAFDIAKSIVGSK